MCYEKCKMAIYSQNNSHQHKKIKVDKPFVKMLTIICQHFSGVFII